MTEKTILLVEDNPDDIELTLHAFKRNQIPIKIQIARDGVEALEYIFGSSSSLGPRSIPSLILLDLKLPKIDGLEVLARIRADERSRFLPIVILSSSRDHNDLMSAYRLGANSYIVKPLDFSMFLEITRLLYQYWLETNELPPADANPG